METIEIDSLTLLQFLKNNGGLHHKISISGFMDTVFPEPIDFDSAQYKLKPLYAVLRALETDGLISDLDSPSPNKNSYTWDIRKNIQMELTTKGDTYLQEIRVKDTEFKVNKLSIDNHDLSQQVSKSVIDTNEKIVAISRDQAIYNKTIADNSDKQTDILKNQKWVLLASVFIAACSAFISYLSYRTTAPNNPLTQEIIKTNKRIDTLLLKLSQIEKNLPPGKVAKKN